MADAFIGVQSLLINTPTTRYAPRSERPPAAVADRFLIRLAAFRPATRSRSRGAEGPPRTMVSTPAHPSSHLASILIHQSGSTI